MKVLAVITEWEFPDNREQYVLYKADLCVNREIGFDVFKNSILMKG
jgi:hypothetical protein